MDVTFFFALAVLVVSVVIHEVSHGFAAGWLGDPTARLAGRLTLNPAKHVDPVGSLLVPFIFWLLPGGLIFGWAKPVPFNPYNLKGGKWGPAIVAAAGPLSNFLIAVVFGLFIRFGLQNGMVSPAILEISTWIVLLNIILGLFNLIPIPPLDGSKILFAALPYRLRAVEDFLVQHQLLFILLVIFAAGGVVSTLTAFFFQLLVGLPLPF